MALMSTVTLADLPGRPCAIAASLALVGERWSLLVIRELALGNTHFGDIVRGTGAPRDRIAARLKTTAARTVRLRRRPDLLKPAGRSRVGAPSSGRRLC